MYPHYILILSLIHVEEIHMNITWVDAYNATCHIPSLHTSDITVIERNPPPKAQPGLCGNWTAKVTTDHMYWTLEVQIWKKIEKKRGKQKKEKKSKKNCKFWKNVKKKEPPSKDLYQVLRGGSTHGSWSGSIVNRKPPRGGFLLTNLFMLRRYTWIDHE